MSISEGVVCCFLSVQSILVPHACLSQDRTRDGPIRREESRWRTRTRRGLDKCPGGRQMFLPCPDTVFRDSHSPRRSSTSAYPINLACGSWLGHHFTARTLPKSYQSRDLIDLPVLCKSKTIELSKSIALQNILGISVQHMGEKLLW